MAAKRPRARKPKNYAKLSQKQKFIAAAKAVEADETGETFRQALSRVVPPTKNAKALRVVKP
jgi:hypothetical protein